MNFSKLVYYFEDPLDFLNTVFLEKQKAMAKFSLREWARQIGYQNPSMLFQVLKGERKLKMGLALKLAQNLELNEKSFRYFELLVLKKSSQSPTEKYVFETMLSALRPAKMRDVGQTSMDVYAFASDWCHWAIYALAQNSDFIFDTHWIQKRLGSDVDKKSIKAALDRFLRLGLLKLKEGGTHTLMAVSECSALHKDNLPPEALKRFQSQLLEKAKRAFETSGRDEVKSEGILLSLTKENLLRAKALITETYKEIETLSQNSPGEDVYQFSSQLIPITVSAKKITSVSQDETLFESSGLI